MGGESEVQTQTNHIVFVMEDRNLEVSSQLIGPAVLSGVPILVPSYPLPAISVPLGC